MKHLNAKDTLPAVVIGAGVVGMMTAYALAKKGRHVTVIDRLCGPAELCSRANAGIVAVGHAKAWAAPEAIGGILLALTGRDPAVRITRLWDPALWRWGVNFLLQCSPAAHRANTDKLQRLSQFSRNLMAPAEAHMNLPPETAHDGGLYLFQDKVQFDAYVASLRHVQGNMPDVLDRDALIMREPGLARLKDQLVGGLLSSTDSVGDCHLFSVRTGNYLAKSKLVTFLFDTAVTGFTKQGNQISAVETDQGSVPCAEVVFATGVETPELCRPLGFNPRIYPVKGYSGTWRILDPAGVPKLPFIDETELLAVASYGERLRVTAIAEFAGRDKSLPEDRTAFLENYVRRAFGTAVDLETPEFWSGLRPSTPSGPPYLGRVRHIKNLWINAGHGQLGWTLALGCGEILADTITGTPPALKNVSSRARWLDPA